jgi:hypothetical protein
MFHYFGILLAETWHNTDISFPTITTQAQQHSAAYM